MPNTLPHLRTALLSYSRTYVYVLYIPLLKQYEYLTIHWFTNNSRMTIFCIWIPERIEGVKGEWETGGGGLFKFISSCLIWLDFFLSSFLLFPFWLKSCFVVGFYYNELMKKDEWEVLCTKTSRPLCAKLFS